MNAVLLICDTKSSSEDPWVIVGAAVQLARVCRTRNRSLILRADSCVTLGVLFALREYSSANGMRVMDGESAPAILLKPIDWERNELPSAEQKLLQSLVHAESEDISWFNSVWSQAVCAGESPQEFWSDKMSLLETVKEHRPSILILLGKLELSDGNSDLWSELSKINMRFGSEEESQVGFSVRRFDELVQKSDGQTYSWKSDEWNGDVSSNEIEAITVDIQAGERLSFLSYAFELILDSDDKNQDKGEGKLLPR